MRHASRFLLAAFLMAAVPAVPAFAGEVSDLATQAEAKAAAGDTAGAMQLLRDATRADDANVERFHGW